MVFENGIILPKIWVLKKYLNTGGLYLVFVIFQILYLFIYLFNNLYDSKIQCTGDKYKHGLKH